jgi:hypothetical protein
LCRASAGWVGRWSKEAFFFEKRTKKLLRGCRGILSDSRVKVFASFFKKKRLLPWSFAGKNAAGAEPDAGRRKAAWRIE